MRMSRRQFTKEFKEAAVRRLELGASLAEVARACEVNPNVLHRWKRELHECVCQVWPPSVLRNTPPSVPTAQPLLVSTKSTLYMVPIRLPVRVPATHVWPPSVV